VKSKSRGYLNFGQFLKSPWPYLQSKNSIWPVQGKTENRKGGFRVKYMAWGDSLRNIVISQSGRGDTGEAELMSFSVIIFGVIARYTVCNLLSL